MNWLLRRRALIFAVAGFVGLISAWRTVRTYQSLQSDLEQLLPKTAPSVTSLQALRERVHGLRFLGVVVDTADPKNAPAADRFVEDLRKKVAAYSHDQVGAVRADIREERKFAETYALQLLKPADVRDLREAVEKERDRQVSRGLGTDLLEDDERADEPGAGAGSPRQVVADLRTKYEKRYQGPRYPADRFLSEDGKTRVLLIQAGSHATGYDADRKLLDRVKADIAALDFPKAYASDMRVGYAGDVATRVEEMEGLAADLGTSGALVAILVVGVIVLFFRSWRALPILGFPLALGTVLAFGIVALPPLSIRHLNSNTAFLASIIVGNGINFGVILLARFVEERKAGHPLAEAILIAVDRTWAATLAAALAASASYGCLVLTDFRGFNQFGWIGAIGMLTCWSATYLLGPPVLSVLGAKMKARPTRAGKSLSERVFGACLSRPRLVLVVTALAVVFAIFGIAKRSHDYLEYDLSTLRRRDSWVSGERYWGKRMDATLKRYLTPTLVMASDANEAQIIEARVRKLAEQKKAGGLIGSVTSTSSLLPQERLESIEEGKKLAAVLTPRMKSQLEPDERQLVDRALGPDALRPLLPSQLPDVFASGLREKNGRMDRNVLVYPKLGAGTWDAQRIGEFARDLRQAGEVNGHATPIAGSLLLSSDIANSVRADGPRMTMLALIFVLVVCVITFRELGLSLAATGSLLGGVVMTLGALGLAGSHLNFSNFVALPITFGIAADYSINVLKRFQVDGRGSIERALANTGGAVALCSATTMIGYGSLLVAQNRALFSFGVLAVAGEIACLLTALFALPAALELGRSGPVESDSGPTAKGPEDSEFPLNVQLKAR